MRYVEGMTQREIREACGISQMQVSRTLKRLVLRLHAHLVEQTTAAEETTTASCAARRGPRLR
jgi:RNA polymerase sigma-B factor